MKLKLTVNGKVYEVDVEVAEPEPPRPGYVAPATATMAATSRTSVERPGVSSSPGGAAARSAPDKVADESRVCRSPISGVVVRVAAQVGQAIQPNDVLVVLEAMKMETVITAPIAGTIAKVHAIAGEPVQRGELLLEFA